MKQYIKPPAFTPLQHAAGIVGAGLIGFIFALAIYL